ncbi:MAG TPA: GNAT family N-acetyltransferase [Streptosporangiaceae bacterium]
MDEVAPLWMALQDHHASAAGHLTAVSPFRQAGESWAIRRRQYLEYLAGDLPAALFLAEQDGQVAGYALVRSVPAGPTLATGATVGHLESLAVLPACRSAGLGRALLDAVWAVLREWGTSEITVNVMAGNLPAEQIYRRMGLVPFTTWLVGRIGPAVAGQPGS